MTIRSQRLGKETLQNVSVRKQTPLSSRAKRRDRFFLLFSLEYRKKDGNTYHSTFPTVLLLGAKQCISMCTTRRQNCLVLEIFQLFLENRGNLAAYWDRSYGVLYSQFIIPSAELSETIGLVIGIICLDRYWCAAIMLRRAVCGMRSPIHRMPFFCTMDRLSQQQNRDSRLD